MKNSMSMCSLLFLLLTLISCSNDVSPCIDSNSEEGIILDMGSLDNCNDYVIKMATSMIYFKPTNLAESYKVDGLPIKFSFESTPDFHDCGFGGAIPVIKLNSICKQTE